MNPAYLQGIFLPYVLKYWSRKKKKKKKNIEVENLANREKHTEKYLYSQRLVPVNPC